MMNTLIPAPAGMPAWKRIMDLVLLNLLVPALLLLFIVLALFIKLVSRGPVFFMQDRIGYRGKRFRLYKFRTMHCRADAEVHRQHIARLIDSKVPMEKLDARGDSRLIPWGRIIRASGMDELPQLINVFKGEMSLVGPRPCTPYEFDLYQPWHKERVNALPGLTGLWQVSGKNKTTFDEMVRLDIFYIHHLSWPLEMKILFRTFPLLLNQVVEHCKPSAPPPEVRKPSQKMILTELEGRGPGLSPQPKSVMGSVSLSVAQHHHPPKKPSELVS